MNDFLLVDNATFPTLILKPDAKIPEEFLDGKTTMQVLQGTSAYWLRQKPPCSYLSSVKKDIQKVVSENLGETTYQPQNTYMLKSNWQDFKLPADLFAYVMKYFQEIYKSNKSEAAVILLLNTKTKEWKVLFVVQVAAEHGSVVYAPPIRDVTHVENVVERRIINSILANETAKKRHFAVCDEYDKLYDQGFRIYGTIHSHCNFGAFHSSTDDEDEINFDGLHITVGKVLSGWDYAARYMLSGGDFKVDIDQVVNTDSMATVEALVPDIKVSEEHMDLMMPNLLSEFKVSPSNNRAINLKPSLFDPNQFTFTNRVDLDDDETDSEWDENVIEESEGIRVFDYTTGIVYMVRQDFYNEHCDELFTHHLLLDDAPISKTALAKHEEYLKTHERDDINQDVPDPELVNFDEPNHLDELIVANVPAVNPRGPKNKSWGISKLLGRQGD